MTHLPHPSDGELLALRDNEPAAELDAGRDHVEHCDECRARLAVIAAQSRRVSELLLSIAPPAGAGDALRRRVAARSARRSAPVWRRPAWQAAAVLVVLAGAASAGPARKWWRQWAAHERSVRPVEPAVASSPRSADRAGSTVTFAAAGPELIVRFDSLPVSGSLTVDVTSANAISARVASGAGTGGDAMLVLPGELHVRNTTSTHASYVVSVPRTVARVRVIVAGRDVFDSAPPTLLSLSK